jgi:hypothetical protein
MTGLWVWIGFAVLITGLVVLNRIYKQSGRLGKSVVGLRQLVEKQHKGLSVSSDLSDWEMHQEGLEGYPSEYNRLNQEIQFILAFGQFLEQHYPSDERIDRLKASGSFRKDTIWGVKINRQDK